MLSHTFLQATAWSIRLYTHFGGILVQNHKNIVYKLMDHPPPCQYDEIKQKEKKYENELIAVASLYSEFIHTFGMLNLRRFN